MAYDNIYFRNQWETLISEGIMFKSLGQYVTVLILQDILLFKYLKDWYRLKSGTSKHEVILYLYNIH